MARAERFSRPVLILKKLAHGFFLIAPTTTQPRDVTWYVHVKLKEQDEYVWPQRDTDDRLPAPLVEARSNRYRQFRCGEGALMAAVQMMLPRPCGRGSRRMPNV
jgi:hypothetical protein